MNKEKINNMILKEIALSEKNWLLIWKMIDNKESLNKKELNALREKLTDLRENLVLLRDSSISL